MRKFVRWSSIIVCLGIILWLTVPAIYAALAKTQDTEALAWTSIALGAAPVKSSEIDCSSAYATTIHVDVALAGTTAHLGTEIIVLGATGATTNNFWTPLTRVVVLNGLTATKSDCNDISAAEATTIFVTNPTTGNLNHIGKFIFKHDTDTVTQSEMLYITACGPDTGAGLDKITVLALGDSNHGIEYATATTTDIYTVDGAGGGGANEACVSVPFTIPATWSRGLVIINNAYGATGSTVIARVRAPKLTGV